MDQPSVLKVRAEGSLVLLLLTHAYVSASCAIQNLADIS